MGGRPVLRRRSRSCVRVLTYNRSRSGGVLGVAVRGGLRPSVVRASACGRSVCATLLPPPLPRHPRGEQEQVLEQRLPPVEPPRLVAKVELEVAAPRAAATGVA